MDGNIGKRAGGRGGEGRGKSITEKLEVKEEQRLLLFFFYNRHMVSLDVVLVAVHVSTQTSFLNS